MIRFDIFAPKHKQILNITSTFLVKDRVEAACHDDEAPAEQQVDSLVL